MKAGDKNNSAVGPDWTAYNHLSRSLRAPGKTSFSTVDRLRSVLSLSSRDMQSGRYRTLLYRFLADNVPVVNACVWTWVRLSAAPGSYHIIDAGNDLLRQNAEDRLAQLSQRLTVNVGGNPVALVTFLVELFTSLYRDGTFGGFLTVASDGSGVDRFIPIDAARLTWGVDNDHPRLLLDHEKGSLNLDRSDFYYIPLNGSNGEPLGRSILRAVPFISFIEQQLVDDMRRTSHNSGYHRLHVRITPPERMAGESDSAYVERINSYFDATVSM
ncbi:MAG: hypothetical protein AB1744_15475, partial [Candidatus Zixiibacteriota bacterium]